ncbi:hypothetical protein E0K89_014940 [Aquicoccus sp. SCR17]|nr:hypothetical protein [Carideicomes alvinocaridis]
MAVGRTSPRRGAARGWWMRHLLTWHWVSGAASLATVIFFALTGILLNHPGLMAARGVTEAREVLLPPEIVRAVDEAPEAGTAPLPAPLARWLRMELAEPVAGVAADYSRAEIWVDLPRPGGTGLALIDRAAGTASIEITRRGWLATAADLHKGRNTGPAWPLVIDALGAATLLFALTGLGLIALRSGARPGTWPVTAGGLALPAILFLLFVHV